MLNKQPPRVLVQGITGREASFWTDRMQRYGTSVVAGVTPRKGGEVVHGIPVYDTVTAACEEHEVDASVLFVPPSAVKAAASDAIHCGIRLIVILTEHAPVHDVMYVLAEARDAAVRVIGPNSPGVVVPGHHFLGIMPAWATNIFKPGTIGVVSRSGSLGTLVCLNLVRSGLGQSAFIGVGGDPIVGTTFYDAIQMFDDDPHTKAVVLVGEVGGTMEEDAAAGLSKFNSPVVAFIAGRSAPEGRRM